MTEKQYKGIAGNFLICDVQKEYAEHLLSILVKRFGMRFQFHFFSNVKKIEQFAEKAEIEILLIAEDCVSEIRGNVKAKKKFAGRERYGLKRSQYSLKIQLVGTACRAPGRSGWCNARQHLICL